MEERIITSDIHCANHQDFGKVTSNGKNVRLQACLDVLSTIRKYCNENNIKNVDVVGDLFHSRDKIDVLVYDAVYEEISKFSEDKINVFLLAGNHDQALKDGSVTSLTPFNQIKYINVISTPEIIDDIFYLPYQEKPKLKLLKQDAEVLMIHQGITEASTGASNYLLGEGVSLSLLKHYQYVFAGQYHKHQVLVNVYLPGSPLQHSFKERGEEKGFYHYKNGKLKFILTPNVRKFVEIEVSSPEDVASASTEDYINFVVKTKAMKDYDFSAFPYSKLEMDIPRQFEQRLDLKQGETEQQTFDKYIHKFQDVILKQGLEIDTLRRMHEAIWTKYEADNQ
jgi:DNA repair exonuclease SbcCD nuclease subunit